MLMFSFSFQYLQEKSLVPVNKLQFLQENMFIRRSYKRHNMTPHQIGLHCHQLNNTFTIYLRNRV